jgi:O-antigen/teichoic acid export membrane protein
MTLSRDDAVSASSVAAFERESSLSRTRSRRMAAGVASAAINRGIGALVPLILIPLTLSYLGADLYGLWMTVAALTGIAAFADFGLGNGLMSRLSMCYSAGEWGRARRYVSSAYLTLIGVGASACAAIWLASGFVPWAELFNISGKTTLPEARNMTVVCMTVFILNLPLSLVVRVQYAYQQVMQSNLWQAIGNIMALPLALAAVRTHSSPIMVVAATVSGPLLTNVVNNVWLYARRLPQLRPSFRHVDRATARDLLRLSGLFFLLTIVMSLATNADALIVAHTLGLKSVTAYAVPARLFAQVGFLVSMLNLPIWPASADALARGDLAWVRRNTRRMTITSAGVAVCVSVPLVVCGEAVLLTWLKEPIGADRWLLGGLALWWTALATISPRFMVQNAAGLVRPQLLGWLAYLLLSVPSKWLAGRYLGLDVVPWIGAATYAFTVLPFAIIGYRTATRVA